MDNPRPNWQDRPGMNTPLPLLRSSNHSNGTATGGLSGSSSHSTTRWEPNQTTPSASLSHATATTTTTTTTAPKGLIPVVRKASPIVKARPAIFSNNIPTRPIRKLSRETSLGGDGDDVPIFCRTRQSYDVYFTKKPVEKDDSTIIKHLTLSEALTLPVYSASGDDTKKSTKGTDSTTSSASSAGSGCRPPLSPKKRIKVKSAAPGGNGGSVGCIAIKSTAVTTTKKYQSKAKTVTVVKAKLKTKTNANLEQPPTQYQGPNLNSLLLAEHKNFTAPTEKSPSSDSSSPRSITDYTVAMGTRPTTGRRSLSKTLLGVDIQEVAPTQPMRRPSSEPDQHHVVVARRLTPPRISTFRAIGRRQTSILSASSSASTTSSLFSEDSHSSDNCDTIATFPSFCSNVSVTSQVTVKTKNGQGRNVTAGDEGTDPVVVTTPQDAKTPAPRVRPLSFLPTRLEQVSEHSRSEHSGSTTLSPVVSSPKSLRKDLETEPRQNNPTVATTQVEHSTPSVTQCSSKEAMIADNAPVSIPPQREILFQPPSSPNALPVDHASIIDRFEDGSPVEGGKSKGTLPGRFKRIWMSKFR